MGHYLNAHFLTQNTSSSTNTSVHNAHISSLTLRVITVFAHYDMYVCVFNMYVCVSLCMYVEIQLPRTWIMAFKSNLIMNHYDHEWTTRGTGHFKYQTRSPRCTPGSRVQIQFNDLYEKSLRKWREIYRAKRRLPAILEDAINIRKPTHNHWVLLSVSRSSCPHI